MSQYLIDQIAQVENIEVHPYTEVVGAAGDEHLERLTLCDVRNRQESTVDTSWLFIFIGAEPRTDWLDGGGGPGRPRVRADRSRPAGRGAATARLVAPATRTTSSPACPGFSPPATCARIR